MNCVFYIRPFLVKDNVLKNAFYRGEKLKSDGVLHGVNMQASIDNVDCLDAFLDGAVAEVAALITKYAGACSVSYGTEDFGDESNEVTLLFKFVHRSFPYKVLRSSVEKGITAFLTNRVLEGWLSINSPEEVAVVARKAESEAEIIKLLLAQREKPV